MSSFCNLFMSKEKHPKKPISRKVARAAIRAALLRMDPGNQRPPKKPTPSRRSINQEEKVKKGRFIPSGKSTRSNRRRKLRQRTRRR